ncbi:MAG: signal recognition particle receptor subunit alpha, partial [Planctomycetota bacterium]
MGLFDKFKNALRKSRDALLGGLSRIVSGRPIDEDLLEEIEEALIESDV